MGFEEMVVAVVGTVLGIGFLGFVTAKITGIIKAWIERGKGGYEEETFNKLAKAFMQHKKDTERRLRNLEAIVTEDETTSGARQIEEPRQTIEIEEEEKQEEEQQNANKNKEDGNLRNMLRNQ